MTRLRGARAVGKTLIRLYNTSATLTMFRAKNRQDFQPASMMMTKAFFVSLISRLSHSQQRSRRVESLSQPFYVYPCSYAKDDPARHCVGYDIKCEAV